MWKLQIPALTRGAIVGCDRPPIARQSGIELKMWRPQIPALRAGYRDGTDHNHSRIALNTA